MIVRTGGATPKQTLAVAYLPVTGSTQNLSTGIIAAPGRWYHIAIQTDGPSIRVYVDGALTVQNNPDAQPVRQTDTGQAFGIGGWGSSGFPWTGGIDEVAIFRGVRRTANFAPLAVPYVGNESGLIALYHLDGSLAAAPVP